MEDSVSGSFGVNKTPPSGQCAFFLERKKRFCRFRPSVNEIYCAEHAGLLGIEQGKKRIVCPLDPKHTCFEDKLEKHLKKCRNQQKDLPAYHVPGINSGTSQEDLQAKIPWQEISSQQLKELIQKVNTLYDGNLSHWIQRAMPNETEVAFVLIDRGTVRYKADNQHKWEDNGPKFKRLRMDIEHLHLGKVGSIASGRKPVVATGKHLCGAATDLALRCVTKTIESIGDDKNAEPNSKKQKTGNDNEDNITLAGVCIALCCHHRCNWKAYVGKDFIYQCGLSAREFQILCKLSGWTAATWTGWKTRAEMENTSNSLKSDKGHDIDLKGSENARVINVGEESLKNLGHCVKSDNKHIKEVNSEPMIAEEGEIEDHKAEKPLTRTDLNLTVKEKEEIGRKCKRLIDFGRVLYMKEQGLQCDLREYIEDKLTPENVAIFAKP
ncbi:hypothetical protein FSP39_023437 [Pinctada imbricata]|uniref:tRNA:m(4)X modification enzyme TRM13 n=1 Tax=Pinctada imbricata TaxID=66713 RepID=A0AA89BV00_PINIB|nr:hypothetical protein FSP39_023437 [Pinctada imbricata]